MPSKVIIKQPDEAPNKNTRLESEAPQFEEKLITLQEFMTSGDDLHTLGTTQPILHNLLEKTKFLLPVDVSAVFLFKDGNNNLELEQCLPKKNCIDFNKILKIFLDARIIEKTLKIDTAIFHSAPNSQDSYLVQQIATNAKKYGIIVVKLRDGKQQVPAHALQIFSILLLQCAKSLDSFYLLQELETKNSSLLEKLRTLVQSEISMQNSQRMLRLVLENIPQCVFWKDVGLNYMGCNNNFLEFTGHKDSKEIIGRSDAELHWNEQELFFLQATDQKVLEYGTSIRDEAEITNGADGTVFFMDIRKLPLFNSNGQTVGILGTMQNITKRKAYEKQLNHMALHDGLTDLPNRTSFHERLERAIQRMQRRDNYKFAVLMLDLDRFKMVNDTFGHLTGDEMLIEVARRIQTSIRSIDTVCRLGGDEFALLLEEYSMQEEVIAVVERLQKQLKTPYELSKTCIFSSASIGVVLDTGHYSDPEPLLRDADIAMYCAKEEGSGNFKIFNDQMHHTAKRQTSLSNDMFQGLEHEHFFLTYQPVYQLVENGPKHQLSGFEVLLRWRHPEEGIIYPLEFLPFAEDSGFIIELGKWILHTACSNFAQWRSNYPLARSLNLAVNISSRQLNWPGLQQNILDELSKNSLDPAVLSLEITENSIMGNADAALETLHQLTDAGLSLAIDDLGTGYSSLPYLFRLPVDLVKIDKSLIEAIHNQPEGAAIVNTMISLASNLNLGVVAEGVEHADQFECLVRSGCTYAQGNLLSPPLIAQQVEKLLGNGRN